MEKEEVILGGEDDEFTVDNDISRSFVIGDYDGSMHQNIIIGDEEEENKEDNSNCDVSRSYIVIDRNGNSIHNNTDVANDSKIILDSTVLSGVEETTCDAVDTNLQTNEET